MQNPVLTAFAAEMSCETFFNNPKPKREASKANLTTLRRGERRKKPESRHLAEAVTVTKRASALFAVAEVLRILVNAYVTKTWAVFNLMIRLRIRNATVSSK